MYSPALWAPLEPIFNKEAFACTLPLVGTCLSRPHELDHVLKCSLLVGESLLGARLATFTEMVKIHQWIFVFKHPPPTSY